MYICVYTHISIATAMPTVIDIDVSFRFSLASAAVTLPLACGVGKVQVNQLWPPIMDKGTSSNIGKELGSGSTNLLRFTKQALIIL